MMADGEIIIKAKILKKVMSAEHMMQQRPF
jgi:hypothetical protein